MQRQQLLERRLSELRATERQDQYREEQVEQRRAEQEETVRHNEAMEANARDKAKADASIKLVRYGLKEDDNGQIVVDNDSIISKTAAAGGKPTGRGKNKFYYPDADGDLAPVYMTTAEYNAILGQAYAMYSTNKDFLKAYNVAPDNAARKSILWSYAIRTPSIQAQLRMYENEAYKPSDEGKPDSHPTTGDSTPTALEEAVAAGIQPKSSQMSEDYRSGMEVYDKYK